MTRNPKDTIQRAYSVLEVKQFDDDERVLTGMATTPTPDRFGDIVEPMGVKFADVLPLLWQHRSGEPVGTVEFEAPTDDGIAFSAQLADVRESGILKDRVDLAWQSVKLGLVRAVSIGFRALELSFMDDGGIRFIESEVVELSLVTIPANSEATITAIKSMDAQALAASGKQAPEFDRPNLNDRKAASGNQCRVVRLTDDRARSNPFVIRKIVRTNQ